MTSTNIAHTNIAMWSGPRNISTAMMYSFGNRPDCIAWDEPFYGFSLKHRGNDHPMRDEIIAANECNWDKLVATCTAPAAKAVFYQKHMTHHMERGFDRSFTLKLANAFLIRSPEHVLASYTQKWSEASLQAIGFVEQAEIFDMVANHLGHAPPVVEADQVLASPRATLIKLCAALNIPFDEAMLKWPKGPKSFDGVWAPHWYNAVWQSEEFAKPAPKTIMLPPELEKIADQARPYYERLKAHTL
jgi:Sulfotransferase domain